MNKPQADREMTMMSANFRLRGVALRRVFMLVCAASVAVLAACGGGGGDPGANIFDPVAAPGTVVAPKAADLSLALSAGTLANNGINAVTATVTAVDENRNALPNIPVTISVDNNAVATVSGRATNTNGVVSAAIGIGADRSNRTIVVTATSGTLVKTASFQVFGATLSARVNPAIVAPGGAGEVEFVLTDSAANAMVGQEIVVAGVGGVEIRGSTGQNGEFKYSYTAPSAAGALDIRGASGGATTSGAVQVQSDSTSVPAAVGIVRSASVSANPSVVPVNLLGSNSNRAEIRALFLTDANAPMKNVRVRFDLDGDQQSIGGTVSSGANVVYTDASGVATTSYIPGSRSGSDGGVTVRACWSNTDFGAGACPANAKTTLTVSSDPLSVSIGTDGQILLGSSGIDYVKRYVVQVNDSSGLAKADVQITPSVDLLRYLKGYWEVCGDKWCKVTTAVCGNEDLNRNGINEIYSNGGVEDANGSLNLVSGRPALEPRKGDVVVSFEGPSRTNSSGQVVLRLSYPQSVGSWVDFNLVVAASVAGTEGRANFQRVLPVRSDETSDAKAEPPFVISPYGVLASPTVLVTSPEGKSGMLCTNPN